MGNARSRPWWLHGNASHEGGAENAWTTIYAGSLLRNDAKVSIKEKLIA